MLLPPITTSQKKILQLLYKFRFLTRVQIQDILQNKSTSNINEWLKDLFDKQYLGRIVNEDPTIRTVSTIYYISKNGIKYLRSDSSYNELYIRRLYEQDESSRQFVELSIFIADIYLQLFNNHKNDTEFVFYTRSDYSLDGLMKEISPFFVFRKGRNKGYYLCEIFREKLPRYAREPLVRKYITKLKQYDSPETPSTVLFICHDRKQEKKVASLSKSTLLEEDAGNIKVFTAIQDEVKRQGIEKDIWTDVEEE